MSAAPVANFASKLEAIRDGTDTAGPVTSLDAITAAKELGALLELPSVGLSIRRARVVGRGARASADVFLSDGSVMTFETLREVGTVNRLQLEVAACTGALPKLKAAQALRAVALLRAIAEHEQAFSGDEVARDWGVTFLQAAETLPIDLSDQANRWEVFSALQRIDPSGARFRGEAGTVAAASVVLEDRCGIRLVRCGWFRAHVRAEDNVSATEVAHRMQRVGWRRNGKTGRIKATPPGRRGQLAWSFYEIPAGWENES